MTLVEFRDGPREIPDHLADLMNNIETYKVTFETARDLANERMVKDLLNKKQADLINLHFRGRS